MGAIGTRDLSVKEKYLNAIQHTKPQRLLAKSAVAPVFHFTNLSALMWQKARLLIAINE